MNLYGDLIPEGDNEPEGDQPQFDAAGRIPTKNERDIAHMMSCRKVGCTRCDPDYSER